jgi:hypothetical protein
MLYVLGGVWEFCDLSRIPQCVNVNLVCVIEAGHIAANTKLSFVSTVESPSSEIAVNDPFDLSIEETLRPVMRYVVRRFLSFDVTEAGLWTFGIRSGSHELAKIDVEFRMAR